VGEQLTAVCIGCTVVVGGAWRRRPRRRRRRRQETKRMVRVVGVARQGVVSAASEGPPKQKSKSKGPPPSRPGHV
jgi:hypothetical protein